MFDGYYYINSAKKKTTANAKEIHVIAHYFVASSHFHVLIIFLNYACFGLLLHKFSKNTAKAKEIMAHYIL